MGNNADRITGRDRIVIDVDGVLTVVNLDPGRIDVVNYIVPNAHALGKAPTVCQGNRAVLNSLAVMNPVSFNHRALGGAGQLALQNNGPHAAA